jgi:hypothetical protein
MVGEFCHIAATSSSTLVKGYLTHHPVMIGKKGDQCDQKELL